MRTLIQEKEQGVSIITHIWVTAYKKRIPVSKMTTSHIRNCITAFDRGEIPVSWEGGPQRWLPIFEEELIKRQ